ncbi:hypothetical protein LXM60_11465 [Pandoraea sputorum]|uniref:hypothetical protein n=1 Tax=Pandoraea sputorum TaxID=93222 RepID=UPI001E4F8EBE|nr:hypothetical protein [Pandoraea sputorum]MCE4060821.1 hypothetical protein [Pandoraea sputorum]
MERIETDYFVTGTGALAMAFVDTLLSESPDARVVMVDRHHRPGGHWNDAYPHVRLHLSAAWYGVPSLELSDGSYELTGFNKGMPRLATGAEVLAYFELVMKQRFLASGRVQWFPKCDHFASEGNTHRFRSLLSGVEHEVHVRRKWVNATLSNTEVPSTHPPKYRVADGVRCIPCNDLAKVARPYSCYTVVGAGKTGMDACIWLIENGVPCERIRWIMPRDPWMMDRAILLPGQMGWRRYFESCEVQFDAIRDASDVSDMFLRLEAGGVLMRIDPAVEPTVYRCALVSRGELAQLRKVGEIVRLGRLQAIEPSRIVLERGEFDADPDTLYIDCSASAVPYSLWPNLPVFQDGTINLLFLRWCRPVFSGSVAAWVEAHVENQQEQNAMCVPVRPPEKPIDFLRMLEPTLANYTRWEQNPEMSAWLKACRLNDATTVLKGVEVDSAGQELLSAVEAKGLALNASQRIAQLLAASGHS